MADMQLQARRVRKRWPADCLSDEELATKFKEWTVAELSQCGQITDASVQMRCQIGPRRIDSFVIVPQALRRHSGDKPRAVKRQAVVQASIQTYLLTKREYAKEEITQEENEGAIYTKRICCRQECIVIDVDDDEDLHCEELAQRSNGLTTVNLKQCGNIADDVVKDAARADFRSEPDALDENPEPDSEPDTRAKSPDPPSPPHFATQPDSEPETEYVAPTNGMQEASEECIRPSHSGVVDHIGTGFADTSELALVSGVSAPNEGTDPCIYNSLMVAVSELQAMDDTASVISESLLHSARLSDATTVSKELKALEQHFDEKCLRDNELMVDASPDKVLKHARQVGYGVGHALRRVANGASAASSQHLGSTLVAELSEFARFAASISPLPSSRSEKCVSTGLELHTLRGRILQALGNAAVVSDEVWGYFGGIEGYVAHLWKAGSVQHADRAASGSAVWQRLSSELQAAILLAEPRQPGIFSDDSSWVFDQLHCRLCYMAARVAWALECQARDALAWMRDVSFSIEEQHSSETLSFATCHRSLQACPVILDLLHAALRDAAARAAAHFLETLDRVLQNSCRTSLPQEAHPSNSVVQRAVTTIKEHLAAEVLTCCSTSLVEFRERWLHGEIEGLGLGRRHREAVDRRHQTLRQTVARSESILQMLQKITAELRT